MSKKATIGEQEIVVLNGNEMAAEAASQINYHLMGYFPITPSTAIPEELDLKRAEDEHQIRMIPADGEHGAAGICYGATTAGGRVINATSANGLLYQLEQFPVQSGTRMPMVMNLVNRAVSGPLNIKGDHSDLVYCLPTGWIILACKEPQEVYDMNIMAVRIGEHKDVRLPVIVSQDGFVTSHQKRRCKIFTDKQVVKDFVGEFHSEYTSVDPNKPVTFGPYMNDDFINNRKQQSVAMENSRAVIEEVFAEFEKISGRKYTMVEKYRMDDAEAALFILNSSVSTARAAVDALRDQGKKVGLVSISVIRPFPAKEIAEAMKNIKAVCVADRQETYGTGGGAMTMEVKAALKDDPANKALVMGRVYGLGGVEFYMENGIDMLNDALEAAATGKVKTPFEYIGVYPGEEGFKPQLAEEILTPEAVTLGIITSETKEDGGIEVKGVNARELTRRPKRLAPGHGACPGCGIIPSLNAFMKGIEGPVVLLFHTGCGMIIGSGYPYSAHRTTYVHNLFQNGAATMSGIVEMYKERQKRGEIPGDQEITFVMITGDGGNDIGMGPTIGAALRNQNMICLEYDNEGYMNTGHQLSFSTPLGHATSTSHVGPAQQGKICHHKDTAQIMAACHIPYVFTGCECRHTDLTRKAAKAQKIAREQGFVYGKVLSVCPLNWRSEERESRAIVQAAVDSCFFPLYEIENGITTINYDPEKSDKRVPVADWLNMMGKTRHITKPAFAEVLKSFEGEVERRWRRLKSMAENPIL